MSTKSNAVLKKFRKGTKNSAETAELLDVLSGGALSFGQLVRAIRLGEEMSQQQFAKFLKISKQQLCDIEKERKSVSPAKAAEYAEKLGYSVNQFVRLALQDQVKRAGLKVIVKVEAA